MLDQQGLFADLRAGEWGKHAWLLFLLGTNVLPTLAHAALGMLTLLYIYPGFLRRLVADLIQSDAGSPVRRIWGALLYAAMNVASIWIVVGGLFGLLSLDHGAVVGWIIDGFAAYAQFIGALPAGAS